MRKCSFIADKHVKHVYVSVRCRFHCSTFFLNHQLYDTNSSEILLALSYIYIPIFTDNFEYYEVYQENIGTMPSQF